jgi:hypothetical protein
LVSYHTTEGVHIQHARNGGEKEIGPYKVDGYYENENGQKYVLEFNGKIWHGYRYLSCLIDIWIQGGYIDV